MGYSLDDLADGLIIVCHVGLGGWDTDLGGRGDDAAGVGKLVCHDEAFAVLRGGEPSR
ncbi:hypothetical protein [Cutibacterium modestum]|uniref:hypothetical protein n=1 Tax=Cutibacterium modestum TaxID=2559073 RepID=UPI0014246120|nr:hypothetical protein [Cutibacterium modestum]